TPVLANQASTKTVALCLFKKGQLMRLTNELVAIVAAHNATRCIWILTNQYALVRGYVDRWQAGERWQPITANRDCFLEDGNHRLCAALLLGLKEIEVLEWPGPTTGTRNTAVLL